jgi:hypothetical protein
MVGSHNVQYSRASTPPSQQTGVAMDLNNPFFRSCQDFASYPNNLIRHNALSHTAQAYNERLISQSERLFSGRQAAVDFLEVDENTRSMLQT